MLAITRRKLNLAFWGFFILSAAVLIWSLYIGVIFLDILLSFMVIAIGFHGLLEELAERGNKKAFRRIDQSLLQLTEWMDRIQAFAKAIKDKHELRLHRLDTKRAQTERKFDRKTKELSKKMIDLENKLNSLKKELEIEKLASSEERYTKAILILKNKGVITASTYSRMIRVSRSVANRDLAKMSKIGIVKKKGKGRSTFYILAI